jgi:predicted transcriptional regulator
MKDITISARVPEELGQQVDRLASAANRNRSWVVEEALRAYLAKEVLFLEAVERGIEAYKRGDVLDHAEVVALFEQRRRICIRSMLISTSP